jgi:hypothetical protein
MCGKSITALEIAKEWSSDLCVEKKRNPHPCFANHAKEERGTRLQPAWVDKVPLRLSLQGNGKAVAERDDGGHQLGTLIEQTIKFQNGFRGGLGWRFVSYAPAP